MHVELNAGIGCPEFMNVSSGVEKVAERVKTIGQNLVTSLSKSFKLVGFGGLGSLDVLIETKYRQNLLL